ncbi:MAG TPA: M28 family peptidase [Candidatus Cloacimonadota bacterium]|nr:M28 family peptidase [Candidatus Cloacimonadota bacterium]
MNRFWIIMLISASFLACGSGTPNFDQQKAFQFLEKQCDLGPRYPGSEEIALCRNLIIDQLEKSGVTPQEQHFSAVTSDSVMQGINIIASFYPQMSRRILLGAHYDTRPWADEEPDLALHSQPILGANDGASGVAVLLEIASLLAQKSPSQYGVDLVFFDLEDMGSEGNNESWCLGSAYFASHYEGSLPEKAIVIDMIGDNHLQIDMEYISYHNSPQLVNEVWNAARELGFTQFHTKITKRIYDDHVPLITAGFNTIDIIDFDYPYWHTLQDTPDKCSPASLQVVGQTLLSIIYQDK